MSCGDAPPCPPPLSPKDLPKAPQEFQAEIITGKDLKSAETVVKQSLPSSDDVKQEKTHSELLEKVEAFSKSELKPQKPQEKISLPTNQDICQEKTSAVRQELTGFTKENLKPVTPSEKNTLPTAEMIAEEKRQG